MAYGIFRNEKARGSLSGLAVEHQRKPDSDITKMSRGIDAERTSQNEHWGAYDYEEEARRMCMEVGAKVRKDSVLILDNMVTLSPEAVPHLEYIMHQKSNRVNKAWKQTETGKELVKQVENEGISQEEILEKAREEEAMVNAFFEDALTWISKERGTLISYDVHWDESTPHLHAVTVPLIEKEDGTYKLSAKELVGNRSKMAKTQTKFFEEVSKKYGLERGEQKTPEETRKRTDTALYWAEEAEREVSRLNGEIKGKEKKLEVLNQKVEEGQVKEKKARESVEFFDRTLLQKKSKLKVELVETVQDIVDEAMDQIAEAKNEKSAELAMVVAEKKLRVLEEVDIER